MFADYMVPEFLGFGRVYLGWGVGMVIGWGARPRGLGWGPVGVGEGFMG